MSFIEKNINEYIKGIKGEEIIREWFLEHKIPFMQVDLMFKYQGNWCLGEIKSQDKYLSPPFDGHGLPEWQVNKRMEFFKDTGIIPYLIIYDLNDKCIYIEKIPTLLQLEYFITKGKKPRIIFNINSFKKIIL